MIKKEKYLYRRGELWWVKIPRGPGLRPLFESTGVRVDEKNPDKVPDLAKQFRDTKLVQKHRNEMRTTGNQTATCGGLLDDLIARWERGGKESSCYSLKKVIEAHLRPSFGAVRVARLTTAMLEAYRAKREKMGRSGGTINRELAYLRIALKDGQKTTPPKVLVIPHFPMVSEVDNVRTGFLKREDYETLLFELPAEVQPALVIGYHVGMRFTEITKLTWKHVRPDRKFIQLGNPDVKNRQGRLIPIYGDMKIVVEELWQQHQERLDCPWVLHRNGVRIASFKGAWEQATIRAGVADLLFHDLRRSAARNMQQAGIPRSTIMKIMGHKTESMFIRYQIVDEDDIAAAAAKMEAVTPTVVPINSRKQA